MDRKKNKRSHKNKNKDAIQFILSNREFDDPNYNNPKATDKILLQVNPNQNLTKEQKKIIESIPKMNRGVFDPEAQFDLPRQSETAKKVGFDFGKSEVIEFNQKKKILESGADMARNIKMPEKKIQPPHEEVSDEEIDTSVPPRKESHHHNETNEHTHKKDTFNYIDKERLCDDKYIDELLKRAKINAKYVEYNEFGLRVDSVDPEMLQYATKKEFREGVDIFIPAPVMPKMETRAFDTDMKEEEMNDEYKAVEEMLKSDSENEEEKKDKKDKNEKKDKKEEKSVKKEEDKTKKEEKEKEVKLEDTVVTGDLEDDFVLLANGGVLPIEFEKLEEKKEEEPKPSEQNTVHNPTLKGPSYKFISKEEIELINKRFLQEEKKQKYISKEEFNAAVDEVLEKKKKGESIIGKEKPKEKVKKKKIVGLTKTADDDEEYEEYESIDSKEEDEYEEYEDEEDEESEDSKESEESEGFKPGIRIEYVSKKDEPDPFDKNAKKTTQKENKKTSKSKSKLMEEHKNDMSEGEGEGEEEEFIMYKEFDKLAKDKDYVEKTIELIEKDANKVEDEEKINKDIEENYIHEPKDKKDITSKQGKTTVLPKTVKTVQKQKSKKVSNATKENEEEKQNEIFSAKGEMKGDPNLTKAELKEKKKLHKKLVKEERRERRKEKKELKKAFQEEKTHQQNQIAQCNKVIRSGLSVKDL